MGSIIADLEKPHAVCIPYPAQGHINPMLKLAKILHHKGFHITFVNTEFNHRRLLKSHGPDSLNGISSFRFETIPDGLPPCDADATQDIPSLCESTTTTCLGPFTDLLAKLNDTNTSNVPPVSCIVSDGSMSFTLAAAQELGVPDVQLWTTSACGFLGYMHYYKVFEKGYAPVKDVSDLTNGYLETTLDWIPAMKGVRLRDLPSFLRTTNPDDFMIKYVFQETERARKASAIVLNTFETLEAEVLESLRNLLPPVFSIGPLHLLVKHVDDEKLKGLGSSLWKEEPECIQWLDSKEPNSVVYVNFGSITVMTPNQLIEFAWGLANSQQTFLWIIRPDIVSGDTAFLPPEFVEETKNRGMLASWCPQEEVLSHPAIGGFLTHSGWNSTLESISNGVPMICWPFFAEQQTNCWFSVTKWDVGMEIDNNVKRDEVESLVRELMVGDKGKKMKEKAMEWKKLAEIAAAEHSGSSYVNIEKVVNDILLPTKHEVKEVN
ncbi:PREDICTED: 7-deoxyloganetin glucosyltransferase-like [Nicotiana attenuata]|uniref:Glycosyltransferase n=1 Tax=Nicotiana attenuata TaxID=49451 RepID=A0A2I2MND5_NICAT|nr:PREDICTED: 7-deoxyloganetin glucosyltransferase-like [Nicotiana attenuata]AQQ16643.1 UDP-glycosyltransferase g09327 [Nicotiana attenuata]OIT32503.1 udp-glycosyltransferase 85a2 [Nicotiana attenuata]